MKKIIGIMLALATIVSLTACGKPYKTSDIAIDAGKLAVEIVEDYLSGKITADTAKRKLSIQEDKIDLNYKEVEETHGEAGTDEIWCDMTVKLCISECSLAISNYELGYASIVKIKENLKDLKKHI